MLGILDSASRLAAGSSAPGATPYVFRTIAGVGDITGPEAEADEGDTTAHSTQPYNRTSIPTLIDPGVLSFRVFWNPAEPTHSLASPYGLERLFATRATTTFRIIPPDGVISSRRLFDGFLTQLGEEYPVSGVLARDVEIQLADSPRIETATYDIGQYDLTRYPR